MVVDENDVLRDEGEAYARRLTQRRRPHHQRAVQRHHPRLPHAQPLRGTAATTAAVEQAVHVLRNALGTR